MKEGPGPTRELLEHPPDSYTTSFISGMLVLDAEVAKSESGDLVVGTTPGGLLLKAPSGVSGTVKVEFPPEAILVRSPSGTLQATVRGMSYSGSGEVGVRIEVAGQVVGVPLPKDYPVPSVGETIVVGVETSKARLLTG